MWLLAPAGVATVVAGLVVSSLLARFLVSTFGGVVALLGLLLTIGTRRHDDRADEQNLLRINVRGADVRGRLPKIRDANALSLGVHAAISLPKQPGAVLLDPCLPSYVPRDVDQELDDAIRDGGLIVVEGPSASGLTRVIYEAIVRCCASWDLLIPADKSSSLRNIAMRDSLRCTVIVLDSLEDHVTEGGLDTHVLALLRPDGRSDIVIIATFSPRTLTPSTDNRKGPLADVLGQATKIYLPPDLSKAEKARARDISHDDPRVATALAQGSEPFAQHLASGPAAWDRLVMARDGAHLTGSAIVFAALECRRLGMGFTLTRKRLDEMHRMYLPSPTVEANFDDGLRWATHKIIGTAACLNPIGTDDYEPLPYLVEKASTVLPWPSPPDAMWQKVLQYARPEYTQRLGVVAFYADRLDIAEPALLQRLSRQPDDTEAAYLLGCLLLNTGRPDEALPRFLIAARSANIDAAYQAALIYRRNGDHDQAKQWLGFAAKSGHFDAAFQLGILHYEAGRAGQHERTDAETWLYYAAKRGHPAAFDALTQLLRENRDVHGSCEIDKIFASDTGLTRITGTAGTPQRDELEATLRDAAMQGDASAMNSLGVLLARTDRECEALDFFKRADKHGIEVAAENVAKTERALEHKASDTGQDREENETLPDTHEEVS